MRQASRASLPRRIVQTLRIGQHVGVQREPHSNHSYASSLDHGPEFIGFWLRRCFSSLSFAFSIFFLSSRGTRSAPGLPWTVMVYEAPLPTSRSIFEKSRFASEA